MLDDLIMVLLYPYRSAEVTWHGFWAKYHGKRYLACKHMSVCVEPRNLVKFWVLCAHTFHYKVRFVKHMQWLHREAGTWQP